MKSVALHNLGCKVNEYEIEVMQQMLQEKGFKIVPFDEQADIYVINTCTVTNIADRKSRQMLHKAKKKNPAAIVVAVGCYVQSAGEEALKDACIDLAIGNNKKKDLVQIIEAYLEEQGYEQQKKTLDGTTVIDINHTNEYESMTLTQTGEHTRAFIKIQDGCNQFCSYCIIPYARGRVRSRKADEILEEVSGLAAKGYKEIVLTGIHISSYGVDNSQPEQNLLWLLQQLHEVNGLERIRLGSLEPRIITEEFARGIASMPKICPHFHLSLQSGCNATLKRMNRRYTAEEYYEKVCLLRNVYENPAITTDVIVGFPGETEEEFEESRAFVEKVGFYEMHVFKYSKRQGTVAASMENQLTEKEKMKRSAVLLELNEQMSMAYRKQMLHKKVVALMEEEKQIDGQSYQIGHTKEYLRIAYRTDEDLSGQILEGETIDFLQPDLLLFR